MDKSAHQFIDWAVGKAKRTTAASNTAVYDFIASVLSLEATASPGSGTASADPEFLQSVQTFAMKFQQFTGPVMAKSFEDTLFYRYVRFACLNEVGGEPDRFGMTVPVFHQKMQQRQQRLPNSMLSTSTHDTKRAEDVRARLAILSELPEVWEQRLSLWTRMNRAKKAPFEDGMAPDAVDEYLIYQTIIGACPLAMCRRRRNGSDFANVFEQYMIKAAREAKRVTSWVNQNAEYETALTNFIERILTPSTTNAFLEDLSQFQSVIAPLGLINSLSQTILKLTCPGVPDMYQGTELWDFSLVDPDNRRPVDYAQREKLLAELESAPDAQTVLTDCMGNLADGKLKMLVVKNILALRNLYPELFTLGRYIALDVTGDKAENVIAFAREYEGKWAILVVPHLVATLLELDNVDEFKAVDVASSVVNCEVWSDTAVNLPEQLKKTALVNLFTSQKVEPADGQLSLCDALQSAPFAILTAS